MNKISIATKMVGILVIALMGMSYAYAAEQQTTSETQNNNLEEESWEQILAVPLTTEQANLDEIRNLANQIALYEWNLNPPSVVSEQEYWVNYRDQIRDAEMVTQEQIDKLPGIQLASDGTIYLGEAPPVALGQSLDLRAQTFQKLLKLNQVENSAYTEDEQSMHQAIIQILQDRLSTDKATYQPYVLKTTGDLEAQSFKQIRLATGIVQEAVNTYYEQLGQ